MPPSSRERSPYERETLIFPDAEKAQEFKQEVHQRLAQGKRQGLPQGREHVAEAVAQQFAQHGESVQLIRHPWEHTPAEHAEAQKLVDLAFSRDLPAAIRQARKSDHYPRNLDLFHDVLTGEMYTLMKQSGIDRQPVLPWAVVVTIIVLIAAIGLFLLVR